MRLGVIFAIFLLLETFPFSFGEDVVSGTPLTLGQYLELVKERHPYFAREALNTKIDFWEGESLLAGQEWVFSLRPYYNRSGEVTASPAKGAHSMGGEFSVSKSVWETGGQLEFGLKSDYTRGEGVESFSIDPLGLVEADTDTFTQSVTVSYIQPLIKNIGGRLQRLGYDLNRYNIKASEVRAAESGEDFLLDLAVRFIDWTHYTEQIRLGRERLELAQEQLEQTEKRYRANLVDRVDVIRAEDAVRSAEQGLIELEARWKAKQAELAVIAQSEAVYGSVPQHELYLLEELPSLEESEIRLKERARVLEPFKIAQAQLEQTRWGYEQEMRPELTLTVSGALKGSDQEFAESLKMKHPDFHVDLELKVPAEYRGQSSKIEKVEVQLEQLAESVRDLQVTLSSNLRALVIQIVQMRRVLELNQELIRSAQERMGEELKLYNQGRGQLNFVIQARDNEKNAKLSYADNAVRYHKLLLQYRAIMDELYRPE
jgi:outer membrane protein TolC